MANPSRKTERDNQIIAAVKIGTPHRLIAQRFNITHGRVAQIVSSYLRDSRQHLTENVEELRRLELARLDDQMVRLNRDVLTLVLAQDRHRAEQLLLKCQEARRALLGIDRLQPTAASGQQIIDQKILVNIFATPERVKELSEQVFEALPLAPEPTDVPQTA